MRSVSPTTDKFPELLHYPDTRPVGSASQLFDSEHHFPGDRLYLVFSKGVEEPNGVGSRATKPEIHTSCLGVYSAHNRDLMIPFFD